MVKVIAINGSPLKGKGNTAMILTPFIEGLTGAGAGVELLYASQFKIKPCSCGRMYCWYDNPEQCYIKDDMELLYPKLKAADILILATPVYIPLPGAMQNFINRLSPLIRPYLINHRGRTRAEFHRDVKIKEIILVSTGGWWEKENFEIVVQIVKELAANSGVKFGGAVLRPHAFIMKKNRKLTKDGEKIVSAVKKAGEELINNGKMNLKTLEIISRPLISEEDLRRRYNQALQ